LPIGDTGYYNLGGVDPVSIYIGVGHAGHRALSARLFYRRSTDVHIRVLLVDIKEGVQISTLTTEKGLFFSVLELPKYISI
jgi:hypothetical protein